MAALMTSVLDSTAKLMEYIEECTRLEIPVLPPPDINQSDMVFTVTPQGIRFGLLAIKNMGRSVIEDILKERELDGPFTNFCGVLPPHLGRAISTAAGWKASSSAGPWTTWAPTAGR